MSKNNKPKNNIKRFMYTSVWIILIAFFAVVNLLNVDKHLKNKSNINLLNQEIQEQQKYNEELQNQLQFNTSTTFIENLARDLGFIKNDETIFIISN